MPTAWEDLVLAQLGAPRTQANELFLKEWEVSEGGVTVEHINNPLNTTMDRAKYPGYSLAPAIPVYPNLQVGAQETARTILGGYPAILDALRHNAVQGAIGTSAFIADLNKWVGHGYSPTPSHYTEQIASNYAHASGGLSAADWTSFDITGSGGGPSVAGGAAAVGSAVGSAATGLFDSITNPIERGLIKAGMVLGGFLLALVGLYLIANSLGVAPGLQQAVQVLPIGRIAGAAGKSGGGTSPRRQGDAAIARGEEVTRTGAMEPVSNRDRRQMRANQRRRDRAAKAESDRFGDVPF